MKRNLVWISLALATVAAGGLLASSSVAHAAGTGTPAIGPKAELSAETLDFADGGGSATVTVKNTGDAPLTIYRVEVVEEGFAKKSKELKDAGPVFTANAPAGTLDVAPGQAQTLTVTYKPVGKQPQAFGALQLYTNDQTLRGDEWSTDPTTGQVNRWVAGVKLEATGGFLRNNALPIMVFFPLLAVLLLLLAPKELTKWIALGGTLVPLGLAVYVWKNFDTSLGMGDGNWGLQFATHGAWIKRFNIEFFMGTDGVSVLMLILTALVSTIACISSFTISKHIKGYFAMFLLLETGMMGTFASLDFFLFYVFWEVMLLPMYFLIGIWGGPRKEYAAIKFFLYTLAGSVLMLLALIAIYYMSGTHGVGITGMQPFALIDGTPTAHTFDMMKLSHLNRFSGAGMLMGFKFSYVVFIGLFIGFAIKVPMFPFHTWLPDAHVEAPTAISVILAGVLLKMGIYGMFRMNFAMLPDATDWARTAIAVFGTINILYGAFCAMAQTDLKKLVAYSSVSHMGYCLLGMAALTEQGMAGSMMQMFNHGTITSMLFLSVGIIYDRAHSRDINAFGGVASVMPRYAAFFGFAFMASLGLPGLSGFVGEALVFLGSFNVYRVMTILATTGVVVTAAYHLWAMQRIQLGPFKEKWREALKLDLDAREMVMLVPLAIIVLILGFYPMPALDMMHTGVRDLAAHLAPYQHATQSVVSMPAAVLGGIPGAQ